MNVDTKIEGLVEVAASTAVRAANTYLETHNLTADTDALVSAIQRHCRAAMPEALRDAREALECRMESIAVATFAASMAVAGIVAAKEVAK